MASGNAQTNLAFGAIEALDMSLSPAAEACCPDWSPPLTVSRHIADFT